MNPLSTRALDPAECAALLAAGHHGRVGVSLGALPAILLVTYTFRDARVFFPVTPNTSLARTARGHVVAFQVDDAGFQSDATWSVLAIGRAEDVTNLPECEHVVTEVARLWPAQAAALVLRLDPMSLTGRYVERGAVPGPPGCQ